VTKLSGLLGKRVSLQAMEAKVKAWGGSGIFITRWLLTPLGPWINLASGTAGYPWHRFLFWDILGELTGAAVFISLGWFFSDRVMSLYGVLGDLTWRLQHCWRPSFSDICYSCIYAGRRSSKAGVRG